MEAGCRMPCHLCLQVARETVAPVAISTGLCEGFRAGDSRNDQAQGAVTGAFAKRIDSTLTSQEQLMKFKLLSVFYTLHRHDGALSWKWT